MSSIVQTLCKVMERIAPLHLAAKWDNVGLLLESPVIPHPGSKHRIVLTIDLTPQVLSSALRHSPATIISYHPPIFHPLSRLTLANPLQSTLLHCVAHGISVYSPHSALDAAWGGVNDWLADGVIAGVGGEVRGLKGESMGQVGLDGAEGRRVVLTEAIPMRVLIHRIKTFLSLPHVQVAYAIGGGSEDLVRSVAICAGSGGSVLGGENADVYLTGEMSHHEILAATASHRSVILCGHTNSERGYLPILAEKFRAEMAKEALEVEVLVSEEDRHPVVLV